jgi:nucleoside-diphosphate-sugar epimerase
MTSTFVVGATGETGKHLVKALLGQGQKVTVVVRSPERLPTALRGNANLTVITAAVAEMSDADMQRHVSGCGAVASCLGHTLSIRGMYRDDHLLVTNTVRRLCAAVDANRPTQKVKFVLMNTVGAANRDLNEPIGWGQWALIGALRWMVPPHNDNEQAAEFLRTQIGQAHKSIEWAVVRPDGLTDDAKATAFSVSPSPPRTVFNGYVVSRANVGAFMSDLVTDAAVWSKWKGRMPCVFDAVQAGVVAPEGNYEL